MLTCLQVICPGERHSVKAERLYDTATTRASASACSLSKERKSLEKRIIIIYSHVIIQLQLKLMLHLKLLNLLTRGFDNV